MAIDVGLTRVLCRGVDLSVVLQNTTLEQLREEVDATVYASDIRKNLPTLGKVTLAHSGLYDDGPFTLGAIQQQARDADDEPFTIFPEGIAVGRKAFIVRAHRASGEILAASAPGGVHQASIAAASHFSLGDGVAAYSGAVAADTQTAAVNVGAIVLGQRVVATVHLLAITGTPSVVFFLESAPNSGFSSPTIRATSAAMTARGSVLLQADGPITDTHWRLRWDHSGSGSFTSAVLALATAK